MEVSEPDLMIKVMLRWPRVVVSSCLGLYIVIAFIAFAMGYIRIDVIADRDFIIDTAADKKVRDYEALVVAEETPQFLLPEQFPKTKAKLHKAEQFTILYQVTD